MLPEEFLERMHELLKEDYPAFLDSMEGKRHYALRLNGLKKEGKDVATLLPLTGKSVPWEKLGRYYDEEVKPGRHALHEAGAYYIQEPSAMAPGAYLDAKPGEMVLDLCAAPGGKTTQIAAGMKGEGLLISNEIHPARARILSENVERMGIRNCLVLNETPGHLSEVFVECFDRIMVDAPCSGEGMFRKNEEAGEQWSVANVLACAKRQAEILECAHTMLKPGGRLVYSTCTFAVEENETSIVQFMGRHPEYTIENVPCFEGMSRGVAPAEGTLRLFPHKIDGEGHFVAVLHKAERESVGRTFSILPSLKEKEIADYRTFEKEVMTQNLQGTFLAFGDELYVAPENCPVLKGLKVLRPGLHLGTRKKGRFVPAHALSHALEESQLKEGHKMNLSIGDERVQKYLHGETFPAENCEGFVDVFVEGYSLGWGKYAGGIMKNHYPKGLRTQY
ncbi:MAG: NOL1/NOP2/sun family putative RNA methylase [Lachnospiraceae bacterium]|jgi:NOL1/NOP2/sun family putative RNA methylase|nr:NOL1/NOP2/sun family putative RNA methylase [Lachnospiraceae bacterium]